jgi:hypothetical protein
MLLKRVIIALAAPAALLATSACTTGFPAQVSRFQALPAPQGQSFIIEAVDMENRGGLEFSHYANVVRSHLVAQGYREANSRADATLVVSLDYGVDNGREKIVSRPDPFYGSGFGQGYGFGFRRPYFSRFGYRGYRSSPFYYGWHDPFWGGGDRIDSFTVYHSFVDLDIRRASDGQAVFEGLAQAQSRTNRLQALVPNLVEALFTGFPGNSGETVRITVPDDPRDRRR